MPRPSHSAAARSRSVFESDLSAINSSRTRTEQRRTAVNTPYHPERYPVAVPCPGPRACYLPLTCRIHEPGCQECDEDSGFSPYGRDVPRHVSHGFVKPEPEYHPHHQHMEADPLGSSRRGRLYRRPSSYDAADGELEFDRRGRSGHYSPPQYDSASEDSCFDDEHGSHRGHESPFESQSLASFFGLKFGSPRLDFRSQHREKRDTHRDRSRRSRSLDGGSMGPPLGSFPDYNDLESFQDHERDSMGPPLINYPYYAELERGKDRGPRRSGVRPGGPHLTRHRFEDYIEADDLEDNLSDAYIHQPRLARPRGHRSYSDVGSIDTDTEEEYFKNLRDFDFVDDAITDRYTGRLRALTAAEKTHRRYLVGLSKDFDREYLRAEQARAELWLQKHYDTQAALIDTEDDSNTQRVARQVRNTYSPGIHLAAADFDLGNRKASPHGRRDDQRSDSESITPQPQNSLPQVRHRATAHPITTNRTPPPHSTHNNPSQPLRSPTRQPRPQKPHSNSNTTVSKDQAPPSYDSVSPAQVTESVQPDPVNDVRRSPLATGATGSTTPNTAKATPRSHAQNPTTPEPKNRHTSGTGAGPTQISNKRDRAFPPPAVPTPECNRLHTSPAELGANNHSDSSDSGAATPMTSDDDDDRLKSLVFYS